MADFLRSPEALAVLMIGISEEALESTFIQGLKGQIQAEVCLLYPKGLGKLMDVAQRIEDRNLIFKSTKYPAEE